MTSSIYTEYAELFTWTFWTCASQMHSRPQTCDFSRQHHGAKTQFSPNGVFIQVKGNTHAQAYLKFPCNLFQSSGTVPYRWLSKTSQASSPGSSRFPIWRRQGSGKRVTSCYVSFYNDNVFANIFVRRVKNSTEIKTHLDDEM